MQDNMQTPKKYNKKSKGQDSAMVDGSSNDNAEANKRIKKAIPKDYIQQRSKGAKEEAVQQSEVRVSNGNKNGKNNILEETLHCNVTDEPMD